MLRVDSNIQHTRIHLDHTFAIHIEPWGARARIRPSVGQENGRSNQTLGSKPQARSKRENDSGHVIWCILARHWTFSIHQPANAPKRRLYPTSSSHKRIAKAQLQSTLFGGPLLISTTQRQHTCRVQSFVHCYNDYLLPFRAPQPLYQVLDLYLLRQWYHMIPVHVHYRI